MADPTPQTDVQNVQAQAQHVIDLAKSYGIDPKLGNNDAGELVKVSLAAAGTGAGLGASVAGSIGLAFPPIAPIAAAVGAAVGAIVGAVAGLLSKFDFNTKAFSYGDPAASVALEAQGEKLSQTITAILDTVPEPGRSMLSKTLYAGFVAAGPAVVTGSNGVSAFVGFPVILPGDQGPSDIPGTVPLIPTQPWGEKLPRKGWVWPGASVAGLLSAVGGLQAQADAWIAEAARPETGTSFFTPTRLIVALLVIGGAYAAYEADSKRRRA